MPRRVPNDIHEDGGFGHGLEADSWNPDSSPSTTVFAINILKSIQFDDVNHPLIKGILRFLESGKHFHNGGWLFSIPSNDNYAHAPWWTFRKLGHVDDYGDMGITGYLVLVETLQELNIDEIEIKEIESVLSKTVSNSIEHDMEKWAFYGVHPSNDVWGITWTWFENNEKYAKEFALSENWWKAHKAIEKLIFLRNFDRI